MSQSVEQRLVLHNRHTTAIHLWIEPWGDRIAMLPDTSLHVIGTGPAGHVLEVEFRDGGYAIYGWSGSVITLLDASGNPTWHTSIPSP